MGVWVVMMVMIVVVVIMGVAVVVVMAVAVTMVMMTRTMVGGLANDPALAGAERIAEFAILDL